MHAYFSSVSSLSLGAFTLAQFHQSSLCHCPVVWDRSNSASFFFLLIFFCLIKQGPEVGLAGRVVGEG